MDILVERARRGDADAFARLFEREKLALWRSIRAVLGNDHDAADVLQETALRTWKALPQFNNESSFGTWAMRVALNASFDVLRRTKREQASDLDAMAARSADAAVMGIGAESLTTQWEFASNASLDVQRTLSCLSSADRLILTLFYVNDLPCAQVAETLGISEGAVRTRLSRARARFREAYEGAGSDSPRSSGSRRSLECESNHGAADGDFQRSAGGDNPISHMKQKAALSPSSGVVDDAPARRASAKRPAQVPGAMRQACGNGITEIEVRGLA